MVAWQGDHWEESGVGLIVENKGTITEPEERREVMKNRLSDFIIIDKNEISSLFLPFDGKHTVLGFSLIDNSMSNTGYAVTTTSGKYFLKLYSNATDKVETAAYSFLKGKINVPELYYFDGSKQQFEYSYAIVEYLDGTSLKSFIQTKNIYSRNIVYEIGKMCAILHRKKYKHDAWLDQNLSEESLIPKTDEHILQLLDDKAGEYLQPETRKRLSNYVKANSLLFNRISSESVLCHGDINYMNILIAYDKVWFIDFEFAHAGSIYCDIGKFFRTKGTAIQSLIDYRIYEAFSDGYNSAASSRLPSDWLRLAHLCDIDSMLVLINRDNTPKEWVTDVEYDILSAIN